MSQDTLGDMDGRFKQHPHAWELGVFSSSIRCRGTCHVGAVLDFPDFIGLPDGFFIPLSLLFNPLSFESSDRCRQWWLLAVGK